MGTPKLPLALLIQWRNNFSLEMHHSNIRKILHQVHQSGQTTMVIRSRKIRPERTSRGHPAHLSTQRQDKLYLNSYSILCNLSPVTDTPRLFWVASYTSELFLMYQTLLQLQTIISWPTCVRLGNVYFLIYPLIFYNRFFIYLKTTTSHFFFPRVSITWCFNFSFHARVL